MYCAATVTGSQWKILSSQAINCWLKASISQHKRLSHLSLVPWLSFGSATVGNVFILGTHFSNDGIHVKVTAVVHLHHNRCVLDLALQLTDFLHRIIHKHMSSEEMNREELNYLFVCHWKENKVYYSIKELPQEVDLIREPIQLGFQLHFDYVGCISVLHRKRQHWEYSLLHEAQTLRYKWPLCGLFQLKG